MANTPVHSFIPISRTTQTTSVLSPDQMVAIDIRVEELRYAFDHDKEMSDEDYETLGHINYCERMQVFGEYKIPGVDTVGFYRERITPLSDWRRTVK